MSIATRTVFLGSTYRPMTHLATVAAYGYEGRSPWREIDWQRHLRWVPAGGSPVNVVDLGEGPPIVWVHGLGGSWQNWLEQLPTFAERHRCVALDLPGFGASPMPEEDLSIPGYGRRLGAVMDALGIESAVLVGNSMGGFIAAELAVQSPQRVEKLVLVSAAGISTEHFLRRPLVTAARLTRYGAVWVGGRSHELTRRPRARRLIASVVIRYPHRLPAALVAEQVRGTGKPGFVGALDALISYRIRDRLGEIEVPTLIVWGTGDRLVPVRDADSFERRIPEARKTIFEDTGHLPQLERPAAFNAVLRDFLADDEEPAASV
jgi:pimeloyl-ACP methyl ester carboxylesterase